MNFLLDTCVISELVKPRPQRQVVGWVDATDEDAIFLSVIVIGEIQKGISRIDDTARHRALQRWLDVDLGNRFANRILPIDEDVARIWGNLLAASERRGQSLPVVDALLAATAIAHNLILVTRNVSDFQGTGARTFNPWRGV